MAAHGTTVIGSPPYMAPEQFEGRAVFASDLYSLGVTMYQMLTGTLPYDTPAPSDLDRLRRGELSVPLRSRNASVPQIIETIVMRAMAPDVASRYQRAEDLLNDLLNARRELPRKTPAEIPSVSAPGSAVASRAALPPRVPAARTPAIPRTPRPRDVAASRFCWQCRKPLPAKTTKCPFCGESQ